MGHALVAALAAAGPEQSFLAPDVADLKRHHLRDPEAGAVGGQGRRAVAQVLDPLDQALDVGLRDGTGKTVRNAAVCAGPGPSRAVPSRRRRTGARPISRRWSCAGTGRARSARPPRTGPRRRTAPAVRDPSVLRDCRRWPGSFPASAAPDPSWPSPRSSSCGPETGRIPSSSMS